MSAAPSKNNIHLIVFSFLVVKDTPFLSTWWNADAALLRRRLCGGGVAAAESIAMNAFSPSLLADLRRGDLTSLRAILFGRTRGPALTALLDARLDRAPGFP